MSAHVASKAAPSFTDNLLTRLAGLCAFICANGTSKPRFGHRSHGPDVFPMLGMAASSCTLRALEGRTSARLRHTKFVGLGGKRLAIVHGFFRASLDVMCVFLNP